MLSDSANLRAIARYCLRPEESSLTVDWLCLSSEFEPLGAFKCLIWIAAVVGGAVALC